MKIYPVDNINYNISMQGKSPKGLKNTIKNACQKVMDKIPEKTVKESNDTYKKWNKINSFISHPMWNRFIIGITALLTQPAIDYYNHRVDDETRVVSRNRTIAKILACTSVGLFVRGSAAKLIKSMSNLNGKTKFSKLLIPKNNKILKDLTKYEEHLENDRATISMILALLAMSYTNFKLDAPLTTLLTNVLNKKSGVTPLSEASEVRYG